MIKYQNQRGLTFIGLVLWGVILAFLFVVGARVVPTVSEYMTINKIAKSVASKATTVQEVRRDFDRKASADYVESIRGRDLEVSKVNDRVVVEFAYDKQIHLFGPAWLLIKYRGSTLGKTF